VYNSALSRASWQLMLSYASWSSHARGVVVCAYTVTMKEPASTDSRRHGAMATDSARKTGHGDLRGVLPHKTALVCCLLLLTMTFFSVHSLKSVDLFLLQRKCGRRCCDRALCGVALQRPTIHHQPTPREQMELMHCRPRDYDPSTTLQSTRDVWLPRLGFV